jgi:predicted membrane channel-forming protein YqfA (hemolysin III family)
VHFTKGRDDWMRTPVRWLIVLSAAMLLVAALAPRIPQPPEYHQFADQRGLLGIPNFLNTISNLAFLFVGFSGLKFLLRAQWRGIPDTSQARAFARVCERWPYIAFFLAVGMTGIGSAYYHLAPDNDRLVWDRLPIALAITALLATTLSERVRPQAGRLLPVLMMAGAASVMYWHWTEQQGAGNLNFYIVVQFYSILVIAMLCIFFPSRYTCGGHILAVLVWYGVAKLAEIGDHQIFDVGEVVSGHTAKHLISALAAYKVVDMLRKRSPRQ